MNVDPLKFLIALGEACEPSHSPWRVEYADWSGKFYVAAGCDYVVEPPSHPADTGGDRMAYLASCDPGHLLPFLRELQSRREAERWIPVTERLPEKDGDYQTIIEPKEPYLRKTRDVLVTDFTFGEFALANHVVTYWREIGPLPAPEGESA